MTNIQVINGVVVWDLPAETGGEITGYDVKFLGAVNYTEAVTNSWYDPSNEIKTATGSVKVQVFDSHQSIFQ